MFFLLKTSLGISKWFHFKSLVHTQDFPRGPFVGNVKVLSTFFFNHTWLACFIGEGMELTMWRQMGPQVGKNTLLSPYISAVKGLYFLVPELTYGLSLIKEIPGNWHVCTATSLHFAKKGTRFSYLTPSSCAQPSGIKTSGSPHKRETLKYWFWKRLLHWLIMNPLQGILS